MPAKQPRTRKELQKSLAPKPHAVVSAPASRRPLLTSSSSVNMTVAIIRPRTNPPQTPNTGLNKPKHLVTTTENRTVIETSPTATFAARTFPFPYLTERECTYIGSNRRGDGTFSPTATHFKRYSSYPFGEAAHMAHRLTVASDRFFAETAKKAATPSTKDLKFIRETPHPTPRMASAYRLSCF